MTDTSREAVERLAQSLEQRGAEYADMGSASVIVQPADHEALDAAETLRALLSRAEKAEAKRDRRVSWEDYSAVVGKLNKARAELAALRAPVVADDVIRDARRYRRLQILGCAVMTGPHFDGSHVSRFTNLDEIVDEDLRAHPHRGEAYPLPAAMLSAAPTPPSVEGEREERLNWARWIVQHKPENFADYGCEQCVGENKLNVPNNSDFVCAYHEALAYLRGSDKGRAILARMEGKNG